MTAVKKETHTRLQPRCEPSASLYMPYFTSQSVYGPMISKKYQSHRSSSSSAASMGQLMDNASGIIANIADTINSITETISNFN